MMRADGIHRTFVESGERFEDILFGRACGGAPAVRTYLETRRQMLVRAMSRGMASGEDPVDHLRVVAIFDGALALLEQLVAVGGVQGEMRQPPFAGTGGPR